MTTRRTDQMTLVAFMQASNVSVYAGSWRYSNSARDYLDLKYYQRIARVLEEGRFDLMFFDDRLAIVTPASPGSPTQPSIDQPAQYNPTWFGSRLVTAKGGSIYYETQPLQFTSCQANERPNVGEASSKAGTCASTSSAVIAYGSSRQLIA